ncbi:hypothetical protein DYH09_11520 [bacterium CPR1]|nr:hypothetical protein [bacterium CPR1]
MDIQRLPVSSASTRPEHLGAARELVARGHTLERFDKSLWRGERWTSATPQQVAEALAERSSVRLKTDQGKTLTIASGEDLLEAHALCANGPTQSLPSPALAAGLQALERVGRLLREQEPVTAYEAYNQLTGDANHPGNGQLTFEQSGVMVSLGSSEEVATTACLAADFGDGKGLPPEAARLVAWRKEGYQFGSLLTAFHQDAPLELSYQDLPLARLTRQDWVRPETSASLKQLREQVDATARELGRPPSLQQWQLLQLEPTRPFQEKLELFKELPDPDHYRLALSRAQVDQPLLETARPLQQALATLGPQAPLESLEQACTHLAGLQAEERPAYLSLLQAGAAPPLALHVLASRVGPEIAERWLRVLPEQESAGLLAAASEIPAAVEAGPWLEGQLARLTRSGLQPAEGAQLLMVLLGRRQYDQAEALQERAAELPHAELLAAAAASGRLSSDGPLLRLAADQEHPVPSYRSLADQVLPEYQKAFLKLHEQCGQLEQSLAAWEAVSSDPAHLPERQQAWSQLHQAVKSEQATHILSQLGPQSDPVASVRDLLALLPAVGGDLEQARAAWDKLQGNSFAAQLFGLTPEAEQALLAARYVERRDLPCAQQPLEDRQQALLALARAHRGDLRSATQDYLFVASGLEDPEALPQAAHLMQDLIAATGSSREARLAYEQLSRLDPEQGPALYPALRTALASAGSVTEAWPLWEGIRKLTPEEARQRTAPLDDPAFGALPARARATLAAGQLSAPLGPPGLKALKEMVGKLSGLSWQPTGSWVRQDGSYVLSRASAGGDVLVSGPIDLPADGQFEARLFASWTLPEGARVNWDVSADDGLTWKPLVYAEKSHAVQGEQGYSLNAYAGKRVRFQIALANAQPGAEAHFKLDGLRLDETKVLSHETIGTHQLTQIGSPALRGEATWTSPPLTIPRGADSTLKVQQMTCNRSPYNDIELQVQGSSGAWERVSYFYSDSYESSTRAISLEKYAGQTIRYRYRINVSKTGSASYEQPHLTIHDAHLIHKKKDQSGALHEDLFHREHLDPMTLARLAADPAVAAPTRERVLQGLQALVESTGHSGKAWSALESLRSQADAPDFVERCRAYGYLMGGEKPAEKLEELVAHLRPGDRLEDLARIASVRSVEQLLELRRRLDAEGGQCDSLAFVARAAGRGISPEAAWSAAAPPLVGCELAQRQQLVESLTESFAADGISLWNELTAWREPADNPARTVRALTQLGKLVQAPQLLQALQALQKARREGQTTRSLHGLVEGVANKMLMEGGGDLVALVQATLLERESGSQILEEANRIILPGTTVARRA